MTAEPAPKCRAGRPRQAGLATVETVVVLPLLLLLLVAVAEVGRAFVQYTVLSQAVRDAARYLAPRAISNGTGVPSVSAALTTEVANVVLYGTAVTGTRPRLPGLAASQVTIAGAGPNLVVSAAYPYRSLFSGPLPTFGQGTGRASNFTLRASVAMRPL